LAPMIHVCPATMDWRRKTMAKVFLLVVAASLVVATSFSWLCAWWWSLGVCARNIIPHHRTCCRTSRRVWSFTGP
jgi:hypothetical protein